jgi:hypothetical protein
MFYIYYISGIETPVLPPELAGLQEEKSWV